MSEEKNKKSQTKAGLMSKNDRQQTQTKTAKEESDKLDNLPKMSKEKAEGDRESEGLH